jgi:hypothetical protein
MNEKTTELKYSLKNIKDTPWYNGKGHSPNAISKKLVGVANGTETVAPSGSTLCAPSVITWAVHFEPSK